MSDTVFKLNSVSTRVGPLALVTIDNGEDHSKPTTLGRSGLESLASLLERLETGDWAAMVVTGKPFVFCVGADIDEFTKLQSAEDALAGTRAGHALFDRIRGLPFQTVGAVNGACLGGGLELALHCDARTIASSVRHVGFPEVFLSIIPAWGGTQLAPRLAGPEAAIKLIVSNPLRQNKLLIAPDALELGLADRLLEPVEFVGAGLMATQLATLFLRRLEVPVVLRDLEQSRVDEALATIREEVGKKKPFLATIVSGGTGWEQFEGCDLVLEAVFEELGVKQEVFAEVRTVAPDAILATNTSSLSVESMGADVGLHFFNPVAVMPLVEIARTTQTTDEQLATAWDVVKKLKKRGVLVGDAPGFVVNRLLTRMTTVLMDAIENGNTVEEADEAILSLGMPMAPSVLREMVGPAVAQHVLETMHAAWPDRFPLTAAGGGTARTLEEI